MGLKKTHSWPIIIVRVYEVKIMSVGDIKSLSGGKPHREPVNNDIKAKLQEEGLRQAARFQESHVSLSTNQSRSEIGVKILNASFNQTISLGSSKPLFEATPKKKESLFDFEEIAKNVLNFVGGALRAAKMGGADDEKLNTMFEQATSGVLKGVEMARKDLAGFMNDEINEGINNSQKLIQDGIHKLRDEIFGKPDGVEGDVQVIDGSASYSRSESGEIEITTKDGDQVTISFENVRRIELNQQLLASTQVTPVTREPESKQSKESAETEQKDAANKQSAAANAEDQPSNAKVNDSAQTASQSEKGNPDSQTVLQERLSYFERSGLSFSLKGELDDSEMQAIASLVGDVKSLAESFFENDVEAAFTKAMELGFDEQELSGYALQLSKTEQVQVIQTYGAVSHFDESQDTKAQVDPVKQVRPIAEYLQDMMAVMDKSKELLFDDKQFDSLVTGLMNNVFDLKTDEILEAINQFNSFNKRLLQHMPQEGESVEESKQAE